MSIPVSSFSQITPATPTVQVSSQPASATGGVLYIFDLEKYLLRKPDDKVWQYDVINFVTALQGIVNRDSPQLYIFYVREGLSAHRLNVDQYWLNNLRGHRNFFSDYTLVELDELEQLIDTFRPMYPGIVLWDPDIPATGNVALTIAGSDNLLPVRYDPSPGSLNSQIKDSDLPIVERLAGMFSGSGLLPGTNIETTGLTKNDAYVWAKALYLDLNQSSSEYYAFMLDPYDWDKRVAGVQYPDLPNTMVTNHDFYISKKAFFMDLDPWWDEVPTDVKPEPFQRGYDKLKALDPIMESIYERADPSLRIVKFGGMVPWWRKYSNLEGIGGIHTPDQTVEAFVSLVSAYNGMLDADNYPFAAIANASVFQHFPLQERYLQNPTPPQSPLENKNYLLFVIGDFRSSALLYQSIPALWNDLARGGFPIAWAINPMLSERVPHIIDMMYNERSDNDFFVAGSTGAGNNFPNRYVPPRGSKYGDDLQHWIDFNEEFYRRFDLRITVAGDLDRDVINDTNQYKNVSFLPLVQRSFLTFSPHGVSTVKPFTEALSESFIPFIEENGFFQDEIIPDTGKITDAIVKNGVVGKPTFHVYRFKYASPTILSEVWRQLQAKYSQYNWDIVDPITFFYLLRQNLSPPGTSPNALIPTFMDHTVPISIRNGTTRQATVTIRNDGWDTWSLEGTSNGNRYRLMYRWQSYSGEDIDEGYFASYIQGVVYPGQSTVLEFTVMPPEGQTGIFYLILYLEQENTKTSKIVEKIQVVVE